MRSLFNFRSGPGLSPYVSALLGLLLFVLSCAKQSAPQNAQGGTAAEASKISAPIGTLAEGEPLTLLPVEADDAVWGAQEAAVTVVAFLDFECRFCADGFETLKALHHKYSPGELRIVFKHLPLDGHKHAVPAAVVGQVVTLQSGSEKFFDFADQVFRAQGSTSFEQLADWALAAGVSREAYNKSVSEPSTLERIIQDVNLARRLGVEATPTFFINGRLVGGAQTIEVFDPIIQEELKHMSSTAGKWAARYQARNAENMSGSLVQTLLEQDPYDYGVPVDGSPVLGPIDAIVTVVAFSDYECPFCKSAEGTLQQLRQRYGDRIRVVFKHLPLPFHKSARPAALLASAVQLKSNDAAFFELTRELFEASPNLSRATLGDLGEKYGLTRGEVEATLAGKNQGANERLKRDGYLADDVLAHGTPHFFVNGKRLDGARPFEHFCALVDYELKRAQDQLKLGIKAADLYASIQKDARAPGAPKSITIPLSKSTHPARGPLSAPVIIHLFSDFECPYCRLAEQNLVALNEQYPGQIQVIWHDFPLPFHERALPLARAGQFALKNQGPLGFWQLHDVIFALDKSEAQLSNDVLESASGGLNLDWAKLKAAMDSAEYDADILKDQELAQSLGIRGTPAFVIGDYLVTGARPTEYLARVVELVLKRAKQPASTQK